MLPRKHRLNLSDETNFRSLSVYKTPSLNFLYRKNSQFLRATVLVSKKNSKLAVMRNLIKRRVFSAVKETIPLETNLDLLVKVSPKTKLLFYSEVLDSCLAFYTYLKKRNENLR